MFALKVGKKKRPSNALQTKALNNISKPHKNNYKSPNNQAIVKSVIRNQYLTQTVQKQPANSY